MSVDSEAVGRFFVRQRVRLASYIWTIVHDEQVIEDILQDVCALALRKHASIQDTEHLTRWMYTAARREALRHLRERSKQPLVFSQTTIELLDKAFDEQQDEPMTALRQCLDQMPPKSKKLLVWRYVDDLKPAEIARRLGHKVESVYVKMSRIVGALGACVRGKMARELN